MVFYRNYFWGKFYFSSTDYNSEYNIVQDRTEVMNSHLLYTFHLLRTSKINS